MEAEVRKRRGDTRKAALARRAAVHDHARRGLQQIMGRLESNDVEFTAEVLRALLRAAGSLLVNQVGQARAVGVLVGVLTNVAPAWHSEKAVARDAAEQLFSGEGAQ